MRTTHTARPAIAGACLTLLLTITACGEDTIISPTFGAGCSRGTLASGSTEIGTLSPASCLDPYSFWSHDAVRYEAWSVDLVAGRAYMFGLSNIPDPAQGNVNDIDPLLVLHGKNGEGTTLPLGASDDEGLGRHSILFFIAPTSGTYQLVVSSFGTEEFGGYQLTSRECPVLGVLDTTGTYQFTLTANPCVHTSAARTDSSSAYAFLAIAPREDGFQDSVHVTVTSAVFPAVWELFSGGFDVYANLYSPTSHHASQATNGATTTVGMAGAGTLAIGRWGAGATGSFTVTFDRTLIAAPPAQPAGGLTSGALRPVFPTKKR